MLEHGQWSLGHGSGLVVGADRHAAAVLGGSLGGSAAGLVSFGSLAYVLDYNQ